MNMRWSLLLSLSLFFILAGCGKEQFGSAPQSTSESVNPITGLSSNTCSTYTLIKPRVDVLYVIDNSLSSYYIASDVKNALSATVSSLSSDFDYRVIGTPLLATASGNNDFQVMTNSTDLSGIPGDSRRVSSAGSFDFFNRQPGSGVEKGLGRTADFINAHRNALIRPNAYLVVVLVSNGRDAEVEEDIFGNGETKLNTANWAARLSSFRTIRSSLGALQLRMISVTAKSVCQSGWRTANQSYAKMATQLYVDSGAQDSSNLDSYDLCGNGISSIFSAINNSIKKVVLNHEYKYVPITFASSNVNWSSVQVKKVSPNGTSTTLTEGVHWNRATYSTPQTVNLRSGPNPIPGPGEPATGTNFVEFVSPIIYPECVLVTSTTKVEYFQYIVLPQKPQPGLSVRINGNLISQSSTNGWSDETASAQTLNIKANYPNPGDNQPPVMRTGFMLKLNGVNNYYKSGDNVQVNYVPAGI